VLRVEGGEVETRALIACWVVGFADIGSVAPLKAHRTLSCSGGGRPQWAPPNNANKRDGRLQEFLGHRGLLRVLDFDLDRRVEGIGV
jgi:hypothetical protein